MISLNKQGYEPFVDFLKGVCILCVLFLHTVPKLEYFGVCFWASMAVPLFLLIQTFHVFKRDNEQVDYPKVSKQFRRIVLPYGIIQVFTVGMYCHRVDIDSIPQLVKAYTISGGFGPGSYYPWIYLQMALALPLCVKWIFKRNTLNNSVLCKSGGGYSLFALFKRFSYLLFIVLKLYGDYGLVDTLC